MPLSSGLHGFACLRIAASLLGYEQQTKRGHAFGDSVGFIVNLPHRRSFGPDVAFCTQPLTDRFVEGAPLFAVEVRSHDEYGPRPSARWRRNARTILLPERSLCGTSIRRRIKSSARIMRAVLTIPSSFVAANAATPSPSFPTGRCRSTICFRRSDKSRCDRVHVRMSAEPAKPAEIERGAGLQPVVSCSA